MDKSSIYRNDSGEYKVSALMNDISRAYFIHTQGQDPYFPEHMHSTKGSVKVGSGTIFQLTMFDKPYEDFKLTANQELYAYSLLPIFSDNMNFPIVIGAGDGCLSANDFMTLILFMALSRREWFHYNNTTDTMLTYCEHLNNFIQNVVSSGRVHSKNKALDYLNRRDKRYLYTTPRKPNNILRFLISNMIK